MRIVALLLVAAAVAVVALYVSECRSQNRPVAWGIESVLFGEPKSFSGVMLTAEDWLSEGKK